MHPVRQHLRVLCASLVGTAVEFFDFYVFATATALVFGTLFFPSSSPAAQSISAFMVFGIAFFARPLGAIAFGHFGDRVGRKSTLVVSLLLMGASTLLVAFLPTYHQAGWIAPALLCVLRFGQGFGLGGEWGGAALLAVENAPKGWEARFGAAPQFGAPLGFLTANWLFLLLGLGLSEADFLAWGWRVPFLFSIVLVAIGLWVRLRIGETPAFRTALETAPPLKVPLATVFAKHWPAVLAASAAVVAAFALFYLSTAYALAQATTKLGYDKEQFLAVQLAAICFLALGTLIAAIWSDSKSARVTLALGALATISVGLVFGAGLTSGSLWTVFATLAAALFTMGFVYGPMGGWLPSLFPVPVRYSGVSVAFNLGGIVGGAMTPLIAQQLSNMGVGDAVGVLLIGAGLVTLLGVMLAKPAAG